jgi:hypothetical protein
MSKRPARSPVVAQKITSGVIDESTFAILRAEDTIDSIAKTMPETARGGDIVRIVADQMDELRTKLGPEDVHTVAMKWIFKVAEIEQARKAKIARAENARSHSRIARDLKRRERLTERVNAFCAALNYLAARGNDDPTGPRIREVMKAEFDVGIGLSTVYRLLDVLKKVSQQP